MGYNSDLGALAHCLRCGKPYMTEIMWVKEAEWLRLIMPEATQLLVIDRNATKGDGDNR